MSEKFRYTPASSIVIEGEKALATLPLHLENLNITNPEWIVQASKESKVKGLKHPVNTEIPIDALIIVGGSKELVLALEVLASSEVSLKIVLIPSAPLIMADLIGSAIVPDLILVDTVLASTLSEGEIRQLMTLSLFYMLSALIEGYDPIQTVRAKCILSRALMVRKELSVSRKRASYLTTTMLMPTVDLGRNRRSSLIISLMKHMSIYPYTIFDTSGMLLIPLARYIENEHPELFIMLTQLIGTEDLALWLSLWKEGICSTEKEETLRELTVSLDALISGSATPGRLKAFLPYLDKGVN